jgi:photosystem II stability/assembly factor-like uncharacterized protein
MRNNYNRRTTFFNLRALIAFLLFCGGGLLGLSTTMPTATLLPIATVLQPTPTPRPRPTPHSRPTPPPQWQFVNVTSVEVNRELHAGRVNAAVAEPNDPNVMYIATDGARPTSANGGNPNGIPAIGLPDTGGAGVWKTNNWLDAKPNWKPLTDDMPSPSVGPNGLVMSPTNTSILYAAADGPQGCILKTTDSGANWEEFGQNIFAGVKLGGIAVSPVDPNTVYVGVFRPGGNTPGGVYKSIDGAKTWSLAGNMQGDVSHVVIDPINPSFLWAGFVDPDNSAQQGVWRSIDGGSSWQQQNAHFPAGTFDSVLFIEFAFAASATQNMYAVVMKPQNKPLPEFYSTRDAGENWQKICRTNKNPDNRYWHQPLTVHPLNPQIVFAEGFNHRAVFSTTGGQAQLDQNGTESCDGVWTTFWTNDDPAGFTFYRDPTSADGLAFAAFGDRGIYRVVNTTAPTRADLTRKQGDLANLLLHSLAVNPFDPSDLYGTAVDQQGTLHVSNASDPFWHYLPSGEGRQGAHAEATARPKPTPRPTPKPPLIGGEFGKPLFSPNNPSIVYNLVPAGKRRQELRTFIQRFDGSRWTSITNGFKPSDFPFSIEITTDAAAWRALEFDPSTSEGLLYGAVKVHSWTQSSNEWTPISPALVNANTDTSSFISAIGIAPSNPNWVYVGTSEATLFLTKDRINWNQVSGLTLPASSLVSKIQIDPANPEIAIIGVQEALGAGRVWITDDGGTSWSDITTDLPAGLQVYTVAVDWRFSQPSVFLGTDRSVFSTSLQQGSNSGLNADHITWSRFGKGLPQTLISELGISPEGLMTAAAYGRGVFRVQLQLP